MTIQTNFAAHISYRNYSFIKGHISRFQFRAHQPGTMSEGESQAASSPMARVRHSEERIYTQAGLTLRIDDVRQKEMASLRNRIAALEQIFNQITPPSFEAGPDTEESDEDGPGWNKDSRILCLQSIIDIEYPTGLKFSSGQWKLVAKQNFINTNAHATRVRYHRLKTECGIMRAHRRQQYPNFVYHPSAANTARSNKEPEHGARTRAARAAQIDEPDDSDEEHSDRAAEGEIQVSRRKKAPKQDNGELAISVGQEDELDADEDADDMDRDGQAES